MDQVRHQGSIRRQVYEFNNNYYVIARKGDTFRSVAEDVDVSYRKLAKFNEREPLFDPEHPRYLAAWQAAADRLLESGLPFELNTGAVNRGYRSVPYPAPDMLRYLAARGARFLLGSDSHSPDTLCRGFDRWRRAAEGLGCVFTDSPEQ